MKIFKKIKKNKKGIALLFVIMLSSILLVVALSISNIATKEAVFSISARNANDAFYAADTGAECALGNDKSGSSAFYENSQEVICLGSTITFTSSTSTEWKFTLSGIGSSNASCAVVTVTKNPDLSTEDIYTIIKSKGYNKTGANCTPNAISVERELEVSYKTAVPATP